MASESQVELENTDLFATEVEFASDVNAASIANDNDVANNTSNMVLKKGEFTIKGDEAIATIAEQVTTANHELNKDAERKDRAAVMQEECVATDAEEQQAAKQSSAANGDASVNAKTGIDDPASTETLAGDNSPAVGGDTFPDDNRTPTPPTIFASPTGLGDEDKTSKPSLRKRHNTFSTNIDEEPAKAKVRITDDTNQLTDEPCSKLSSPSDFNMFPPAIMNGPPNSHTPATDKAKKPMIILANACTLLDTRVSVTKVLHFILSKHPVVNRLILPKYPSTKNGKNLPDTDTILSVLTSWTRIPEIILGVLNLHEEKTNAANLATTPEQEDDDVTIVSPPSTSKPLTPPQGLTDLHWYYVSKAWMEAYWAIGLPLVMPASDAAEFLLRARQANAKIIVTSGGMETVPLYEELMARLGMRELIHKIVGGSLAWNGMTDEQLKTDWKAIVKCWVDIAKESETRHGKTTDEEPDIVMVSRALRDTDMIKITGLGIKTCWVKEAEPSAQHIKPDIVVQNLEELANRLFPETKTIKLVDVDD